MLHDRSARHRESQDFQPQNTWEEWVCCEDPNAPGVLLRLESDATSFAALSGIKLVGTPCRASLEGPVFRPTRSSDSGRDNLFAFLLANINSSQRMEIVYSNELDSDGTCGFSLKVLYSLRAPKGDQATRKAHQRWQQLMPMLSTFAPDHSFMPAPLADVRAASKRGTWSATLKPEPWLFGIENRARIGFMAERCNRGDTEGPKHSAAIAFSLPSNNICSHDFDGLARSVAGCTTALRVSLGFEPLRLRPGDLQFLKTATDALFSDSARVTNPTSEEMQDLDIESSNYLQRLLAQWTKQPAGYRMSCTVSASRPLPTPLLEFIGREAFQCDSIRIVQNAPGQPLSADDSYRVDLCAAINRSGILPAPFPSARVLAEIGIRRLFNGAPPDLSRTGMLLGHAGPARDRKEVRFARTDRTCHSYVVGATGGGKSTLLYNMIVQDMQNGDGVALIDPHGDLYQAVLASVPSHRAEDVVLIDCCDFERAVGLNFLECEEPRSPHQMNFIANELIKIFDELYDLDKTGGPVFEQYMRNALLLAMDNEAHNATLMDIPLIFEDASYRRSLISTCGNRIVADFWSKQAERAGGDMALNNIAPYVTSKLNQFTSNALLRPMIGQTKNTIDFREVMDQRKILLVNLSKGRLGELDAQLLGMLIIGKLFCAALDRASIEPELRHPLYLYVDEFQNFTTQTVTSLLAEGRKYGLHLTLANQNLGQLSRSNAKQRPLEAVIGNCGSLFMFRQGAIDAQYMQSYTVPHLNAQDLQELPAYHVATTLLFNKRPSRPFVFETSAPNKPGLTPKDVASLVKQSRRKYTRLIQEVEQDILERRNLPDTGPQDSNI